MSKLGEENEPCWKVLDCSKYVYQNCPVYLYPERPCWENAYTQSEMLLGVQRDCKNCKFFKIYGNVGGETSDSELNSNSNPLKRNSVRPLLKTE